MIACVPFGVDVAAIGLCFAVFAALLAWVRDETLRYRSAIRLAVFDLEMAQSGSNSVEARLILGKMALDTLRGVRD